MIRIEPAPAGAVRPLRAAVLRPGLPLAESVYPDDERATHLAAIDDAGAVVGCVTVFARQWPTELAPGLPELPAPHPGVAWQLRGMATEESVRGTGLGGRLLVAALEAARDGGADWLWCNARTHALGFYARYGFAVGEAEYPSGPHHVPHHRAWIPLRTDGAEVGSARP